ncbi:MAG: NAD(P)H-binding protein [Bacteroidetes bacterium]|nr:NAD(P)H-binding protein [Bacteroidota bacterium]
MKYIITGSTGHISLPLIKKLKSAGHEVGVISSNHSKTSEIEALGAKAWIGSVENQDFLNKAFQGADAVYTMVPPHFGAGNWKQYIAGIGKNYAEAIKANNIRYVVNLSSIGAHMPDGCGPVSGLYHVEAALNQLEGVHVKHLRPGFFYYNFLGNISMIKNMGIIGGNYGNGTSVVVAAPDDIADAAAEELLNLSFTGKSVRYIASDEKTTTEIAEILGKAIGKPELPWVDFKDEDTKAAMEQAGLPAEIAGNYTEMGAALRSGNMAKDYYEHKPSSFGKTKFEDFAKTFAAVYSQS